MIAVGAESLEGPSIPCSRATHMRSSGGASDLQVGSRLALRLDLPLPRGDLSAPASIGHFASLSGHVPMGLVLAAVVRAAYRRITLGAGSIGTLASRLVDKHLNQ